jgi:hypothetical protein
MKHINAKGYLNTPEAKGFAHELNWVWFELWHHEGRRMRHGASMMGPDFTHWHGSYEVAKHFYVKFLPKVRHLAEKKNDTELLGMIDEIMKRPEHGWFDGMDPEEIRKILEAYKKYPTLHLEK